MFNICGLFLNKKLLINIQEQYFFGLNEESLQHYYLVQYIRYKIGKIIQTGILSYGKWKTEEPFNQGHCFIGPSIDIKLSYNFNLHTAVTKDVLQNGTCMTYIRLGYRVLWKQKIEISND